MAGTTVTVVGNMTRDPEVKFTPAGKTICSFAVAVGSRKKQGDEWVDGPTSFYSVTCWDQLAQNVADSLEKGTRVVVSGRLQVRDWETDDGKKGRSVEVTADEVAASLRWATVEVTKATRSKPTEDGAPSGYDPSDEPF